MAAILDVKGIRKTFADLVAVQELSFHVEEGEAFGLLGPNGAGKSTTMMMIAGVLQPDAGSIQLAGKNIHGTSPSSRLPLGVVPQELAIYPDLSAEENLQFFGRLYQLPHDRLKGRIHDVLDQVGLSSRRKDVAGGFSGGMKRRLNFAAAILHQPRLLILDEPTVGVDPQSRSHLVECIRGLQRNGTAVIYASHYMEEVEAICSRVAVIDHGQLLTCDSLEALLQRSPTEIEILLPAGGRLPQRLRDDPTGEWDAEQRRLILRVPDSTKVVTTMKESLQWLQDDNQPVESVHTYPPSLERLFLQLTGTALRD